MDSLPTPRIVQIRDKRTNGHAVGIAQPFKGGAENGICKNLVNDSRGFGGGGRGIEVYTSNLKDGHAVVVVGGDGEKNSAGGVSAWEATRKSNYGDLGSPRGAPAMSMQRAGSSSGATEGACIIVSTKHSNVTHIANSVAGPAPARKGVDFGATRGIERFVAYWAAHLLLPLILL